MSPTVPRAEVKPVIVIVWTQTHLWEVQTRVAGVAESLWEMDNLLGLGPSGRHGSGRHGRDARQGLPIAAALSLQVLLLRMSWRNTDVGDLAFHIYNMKTSFTSL